MNNGDPEIPPDNPAEVPPEKIPPDIPPGNPLEEPEPPQETPPKPPLEVPPSPTEFEPDTATPKPARQLGHRNCLAVVSGPAITHLLKWHHDIFIIF
jgi:hypothetical protein